MQQMSERLAHRGPDDHGTVFEGPFGAAHRRRDSKAAGELPERLRQPLLAADAIVMMDGHITDPDGVIRRVCGPQPDVTEPMALLEAWRRWGIDLVHEVEGSFSAAIWNRRSKVLHLLRDPLGQQPLFWARQDHRFAFASSLPALLEVPWLSAELAREHLSEYLSFQTVHSPRTLLRDVHQVEPGTWLQVGERGLNHLPYWSFSYQPDKTRDLSEAQVIGELQETVTQALAKNLSPASTKAGISLSGGLGSTTIAATARKMGRNLPTYTVHFADDPFPESPFAGRVARILGTDHHEVTVTTLDLSTAFEETIQALGQPIGHPSAVFQLLTAKKVREQERVLLSGDGGEELFGGKLLHGMELALKFADTLERLPNKMSQVLYRSDNPTTYGLTRAIGGQDLFSFDEQRILLRQCQAPPDFRKSILKPFYDEVQTDPINAILHASLRSWLMEGAVVCADRTAAWSGLDARFPLLDRSVVQLACSLAGRFKVRRMGGSLHSRWMLRSLLSGVLPTPLITRPKRELPLPVGAWLQGAGRLFMEDHFSELTKDRERLFNRSALFVLRQQVGKVPGVGRKLWNLFILDAWLRSLGKD